MKKLLAVVAAAIGLTAMTAFAQTGGGGEIGVQKQQPGGDIGSQQSTQMMGSQMMNQDMMRDMTRIMKQMNEMMQKLTHNMEHKTVTDHAMMQDMGKMMREMSSQMNEMAQHMEQGKLDKPTVKKMQEHMKAMNQRLEKMMEKESK